MIDLKNLMITVQSTRSRPCPWPAAAGRGVDAEVFLPNKAILRKQTHSPGRAAGRRDWAIGRAFSASAAPVGPADLAPAEAEIGLDCLTACMRTFAGVGLSRTFRRGSRPTPQGPECCAKMNQAKFLGLRAVIMDFGRYNLVSCIRRDWESKETSMMPPSPKGLSLSVLLVLAAFAAGGCCQKQEQELAALKKERNDLSAANIGLQGKLSKASFDKNKAESDLQAARSDLAGARQEIVALKKKAAAPPPPPRPRPTLFKKTIETDVLFAAGKASLSNRGKRALGGVVSSLKNQYAGHLIRVYGHTDSDPIKKSKWKSNLELSSQRAMAVKRYLASKGVPAADIETIAMGAKKPVADNRTSAGKARNRRVEIEVVKR